MGDRIAHHKHADQGFLSQDSEQLRAATAQRNAEHWVAEWEVPDAIRQLPCTDCQLLNPHHPAVFRNPLAVGFSILRWSESLPSEWGLNRAS